MSPRSPRGQSPMRSPDRNPAKSPRGEHRPRSVTRSPSPDRQRRTKSRSRSVSRGRSPSRSRSPGRGGRRYRSASYSRSPSPNQSPPQSAKIVVEKLTKNVTEKHLREIFGSFGDIEYLDLPMNRSFMTNRGTAYILYYDPADAEAAIAHMHEAQLDGAILNVSIVLPRRTFSRSPPPSNRGRGGRSAFGKRSYAESPPRRHGRQRGERRDTYRPPSLSRSRSPVRSRSYSRSPPPRRGSRRPESPRQRRRRSPSYSSYGYSSRDDRSRSPVRSRSRNRY